MYFHSALSDCALGRRRTSARGTSEPEPRLLQPAGSNASKRLFKSVYAPSLRTFVGTRATVARSKGNDCLRRPNIEVRRSCNRKAVTFSIIECVCRRKSSTRTPKYPASPSTSCKVPYPTASVNSSSIRIPTTILTTASSSSRRTICGGSICTLTLQPHAASSGHTSGSASSASAASSRWRAGSPAGRTCRYRTAESDLSVSSCASVSPGSNMDRQRVAPGEDRRFGSSMRGARKRSAIHSPSSPWTSNSVEIASIVSSPSAPSISTTTAVIRGFDRYTKSVLEHLGPI
jgi:hypothetical protein